MYGIEHFPVPTDNEATRSVSMYSRLEDRIRELCSRALATSDSPELTNLVKELRAALHEHTERLRQRLQFPIPPDRRTRTPDSSA